MSEGKEGIRLFQDTIRLSIIPRPKGNNPRGSMSDEIILQASTIVLVDDNQSYLLEVGQFCGIDHKDGKGDYSGSKMAEELKNKIKEFADSLELKVLPGIIGF